MSTANYGDIYAQFLAGGYGGKSEVLPTGTYRVKIALVKGDQKQGKKFGVGVRLTVLEGPHEGKSTWVNQSLTEPKPGDDKSTTAFVMFLKFHENLGVDMKAALSQGTPPTELFKLIPQGAVGVASLKGDRIFNAKPQQDLNGFELEAVPSPVGGMIPVGGAPVAPVVVPVAVAAPVAAPVAVVAPVAPVAAPAPVVQPAPTQQPAPVADVAALQAQIAALQAQQAAPVVAAAPVPAGPSF